MLVGRSALLIGGWNIPIAFRSMVASSAATSVVTKPAGIAVGDLVVVIIPDGSGIAGLSTTAGSAWAFDGETVGGVITFWSWKVLNATDVANTWNTSANHTADTVAYAYEGRGATTLTRKLGATSSGAVNTLDLGTGYAPSATTKGFIAYITDNAIADAPTVPAGFQSRGGTAGARKTILSDNLISYNGGPVIWTTVNSSGSNSGQSGTLFEVT